MNLYIININKVREKVFFLLFVKVTNNVLIVAGPIFSFNEMHIKNILLFAANVNIKATTDVMLVIMHEHATGKSDHIDKDFVTEVFEECYTNSDDDFDFTEYDSYTELCELLDTYFPLI